MPLTYAPPLATGLATDVPVKKADLAAWLGQIAAAITGVEASQSRVYASRDEAVTQVTASPPPEAVTRIVSTEGSALVIRGRSASADDPLLPAGGPRWGVLTSIDFGASQDRAKHTGTQPMSSVSGLEAALTAEASARAAGDEATYLRAGALASVVMPARGDTVLARDRNGVPMQAFTGDGKLVARLDDWTTTFREGIARGGLAPIIVGAENRPVLRSTADGRLIFRMHSDTLNDAFYGDHVIGRGDSLVLIEDPHGVPVLWYHPRLGLRSIHDGIEPDEPDTPDTPTLTTGHSGQNGIWPRADAFDVVEAGGLARYLSPQVRGETRRYVAKLSTGVSIPDASAPHAAVISVGQPWRASMSRDNEWRFHVTRLDGSDLVVALQTASAGMVAEALTGAAWAARERLRAWSAAHVSLASQPVADMVTAVTAPMADALTRLDAAAASFGIADVSVRVLPLSFGSGDKSTARAAATASAVTLADNLRVQTMNSTGQVENVHILYTQFGGTRLDGDWTGILAGTDAWTADPLVEMWPVAPLYAFQLAAGADTPSTDSRIAIAGLEAEAVAARTRSEHFYCPTMMVARRTDAVISVEWDTLTGLEIDAARRAAVGTHGFVVDGITNGATIIDVGASGNVVTITLSAVPTGTLRVRYAYGMTAAGTDNWTANRGALRETWSAPNPLAPSQTLRRWALADDIAVT